MRRSVPLAPAPRRLALVTRLTTLLRAGYGMLGWVFIAFSSIFVWIFALNSELVTHLTFVGERGQVTGEVKSVEATNSSENEQTVLRVNYRYQLDNRQYTGVSYSLEAPLDPGDKVDVEYLVAKPSKSRIRGMRVRSFGIVPGLFTLLFPLIGVLLVGRAFFHGRRINRLLENGELGWGRLVDQKETNTRINDNPVYALTYQFQLPPPPSAQSYRGGWAETHHFTIKTHETDRITDEAEEPLLFLRNEPGVAELLDNLPASIHLDQEGQVRGGSPLLVIAILAGVALYGLIVVYSLLG